MRKIETIRALILAAMLAVPVGAGALAGEEQPIPPPPPPPAANPGQPGQPAPAPGEKTTVANPLDDNWVIDPNGRRDPFTFTKALANLKDDIGPVDPLAPPPGELPREEREKKRNNAELAVNQAEGLLMELDAANALAQCDKGMEEFKGVEDIARYPELEVVKGRLLRARKASDQMRSRQTAERDFGAMNIKIQGVSINKKSPMAIINSKTVKKGETVSVSGDNTDVMVDEIQPERVVFLFRGYRMTLLVAESSGK